MKFWLSIVAIAGIFLALVLFGGQKGSSSKTTTQSPSGTLASMVGKPAPNFTLQTIDGKSYSLSSLRGKKVILFFNEGIMCYPACWNQMAALGSDQQLNNDNVVTASIVPDGKDEWAQAVRKMPELGKETILLDTDTAVSRQYGMVNLASSMHKGMKPGHTYIIIDTNGVVRYTKDDTSMGINNGMLNAEVSKI